VHKPLTVSAAQPARIAGIRVDLVTTADVLRMVKAARRAREPVRIVTVNAEFVVRAQHDVSFRDAIERADVATPDSTGILWALRRQGHRLPYRVGGSDLIWSLCLQAAEFGQRVFLLGGQEGIGERAASRLHAAYPDLAIAGVHAGSPSPHEEADIVHLIRRSRTDILFVAFGAPQQDLWIDRNLARTGATCALGVGGSLDYVAGTTRRAPVWMRQAGLDWLWRLLHQPWRWRRMLALPRFVWLVIRHGEGGRQEAS
jgi:N-acetylglucosaminyldiphosphoundecaprenol N-acetyl-beta-D-mannosaminyltransferase